MSGREQLREHCRKYGIDATWVDEDDFMQGWATPWSLSRTNENFFIGREQLLTSCRGGTYRVFIQKLEGNITATITQLDYQEQSMRWDPPGPDDIPVKLIITRSESWAMTAGGKMRENEFSEWLDILTEEISKTRKLYNDRDRTVVVDKKLLLTEEFYKSKVSDEKLFKILQQLRDDLQAIEIALRDTDDRFVRLEKRLNSLENIVKPDETDVHNINRRIELLGQKFAEVEHALIEKPKTFWEKLGW